MLKKVSFVAAVLVVACKSEAPTTEQAAAPAQAAAPIAEVTPVPSAPIEGPALLTVATSLVRQPVKEDKITDPKTGKQVSNWQATLFRGDAVTILSIQGEWAKVKASDDSEGFVKTETVIPAADVALATVHEDVKMFLRPDFSALNAGKTIPMGTLLLTMKSKDPFTEVNVGGTSKSWVMADKLVRDAKEVEAARIIARARAAEKQNKADAAKELWDLAKTSFGDTKIVQLVTAPGAVAPTDAPPAEAEAANPAPAPAAAPN